MMAYMSELLERIALILFVLQVKCSQRSQNDRLEACAPSSFPSTSFEEVC